MEDKTHSVKRISKLSSDVSNRIAAGEVIQRPGNAVKELIENSLDAGSNSIQIQVKDGGIKMLQIQDDGSGIDKDDLVLACEKYTTSKIRRFDDLNSIETFGFRGEALASISHIAKVIIISKTSNSDCAYRASYYDGALTETKGEVPSKPQPCAGTQGTTIIIEDLFFNYPMRKKVLRSSFEEYQMVLDIANRYAIHSKNVSFNCKKQGSTFPDLQVNAKSSTVEKISQIYGKDVALDLVEFKVKDDGFKFNCEGYITQTKYRGKKMGFLLFINNRSVMWSSLKRVITNIYTPLLMRGNYPFIYLSINLPPELVDVNIHPTKKEVHFLHEEEILTFISSAIQEKLEEVNSSRIFNVNNLKDRDTINVLDKKVKSELLPQNKVLLKEPLKATSDLQLNLDQGVIPIETSTNFNLQNKVINPLNITRPFDTPITSINNEKSYNETNSSFNMGGSFIKPLSTNTAPAKRRDNHLVRTDNKLQTLFAFYPSNPTIKQEKEHSFTQTTIPFGVKGDRNVIQSEAEKENKNTDKIVNLSKEKKNRRKRVQVCLESVLELISGFKDNCDNDLKAILANSVYVGCIDTKMACAQSGTGLYLLNYSIMSFQLFYQIILLDFCNFSTIEMNPPLPIYDVLKLALNSGKPWPPLMPNIANSNDPAKALTKFLIERNEMIQEYFLIYINDNGFITKIPALIPNYVPFIYKFPEFLVRLGSQVDWKDEKGCFFTLSKEIARLYQFEPSPKLKSEDHESEDMKNYLWQIQHTLFPQFKKSTFYPSKELHSSEANSKVIVQLTSLPELYKVFERC